MSDLGDSSAPFDVFDLSLLKREFSRHQVGLYGLS